MILDTFLKGILIGLSISVPLGPIGMLCIQRTLNRGQKYGLTTGFGATFSDLIYSLITVFFLNFVIDFVEKRQFILQIIGSLIIVIFGIWIYTSHAAVRQLPHEKPREYSLTSDFFSSFALTLSNPLILFVLIALFAQFDFIAIDATIGMYAWALFSILLGATLWWIVLTTLANRFRNRFSIGGLKLINKLTGGIIMLIGIVGFITSFIN